MNETAVRAVSPVMGCPIARSIDWDAMFPAVDRVEPPAPDTLAGKQAGPGPVDGVLDYAILEQLERLIGGKRLRAMLDAFEVDIDKRLSALETISAPALSGQAHALRSSSGQLGFLQLSRLSADIEEEARRGGGLHRIADLRAAVERARAAARASRFVQAL